MAQPPHDSVRSVRDCQRVAPHRSDMPILWHFPGKISVDFPKFSAIFELTIHVNQIR